MSTTRKGPPPVAPQSSPDLKAPDSESPPRGEVDATPATAAAPPAPPAPKVERRAAPRAVAEVPPPAERRHLEVVASPASFLEGRSPEPPPSPANVLRLDPLPNWVYLHHPHRWDIEIDQEGVAHLVPTFRKFLFEPGLSGVEAMKGNPNGNPNRALASKAEFGWTEIPRGMEVPAWGGRVRGYVRMFDGHRGPVHLDVWTRPYVLGGKVELDLDVEGRLAWKIELLASGIIKPPTTPVLRGLRTKFRRSLQMRQTTETAGAISAAELIEQKMAVLSAAGGRS